MDAVGPGWLVYTYYANEIVIPLNSITRLHHNLRAYSLFAVLAQVKSFSQGEESYIGRPLKTGQSEELNCFNYYVTSN